MKLLIITQAVDKNNPVLGFFHRWIEEFSKKFESIVVVCLEKGEFDLPKNVKVLSLGKPSSTEVLAGKENKEVWSLRFLVFKKMKYIWNFYKYIWQERKNYDSVFVHMNQEYVILGWKAWFLLGKKIYMWRNHPKGNFITDFASFFCKKVFCTSKFSYTAGYKKTVIMPVGIDTEVFQSNKESKENSILFLGRIAPVKKPDMLIDALAEMKEIAWSASVVGSALPKDKIYFESLKEKVHDGGMEERINFIPGVPNTETKDIYSSYKVFVNLSPSGMYDKTIFEAAACGCLLLVSNENLRGEISDIFIFDRERPEEFILKLKNLLALTRTEKESNQKELRIFAKKHDLRILSDKLFKIISIG